MEQSITVQNVDAKQWHRLTVSIKTIFFNRNPYLLDRDLLFDYKDGHVYSKIPENVFKLNNGL